MTNEFEQSALAYQKSSLEWQQRYNIAVAERDALRERAAAAEAESEALLSVLERVKPNIHIDAALAVQPCQHNHTVIDFYEKPRHGYVPQLECAKCGKVMP